MDNYVKVLGPEDFGLDPNDKSVPDSLRGPVLPGATAVLTDDPALHETKGWLKAELERTRMAQALGKNSALLAKTLAKMELTRSRAATAAARLVSYRDPEKPAPRTEEELMDLVDYLVQRRPRDPVSGRPCPLMAYERKAIEVWHRFRRATLVAERRLAEAAPTSDEGDPMQKYLDQIAPPEEKGPGRIDLNAPNHPLVTGPAPRGSIGRGRAHGQATPQAGAGPTPDPVRDLAPSGEGPQGP